MSLRNVCSAQHEEFRITIRVDTVRINLSANAGDSIGVQTENHEGRFIDIWDFILTDNGRIKQKHKKSR